MKERVYSPPESLRQACAQSPLVIVDVGARGGLQAIWQPLAEHITWVGFEPDTRSADAMEALPLPHRSHILRVALSHEPGRVVLHRARDEGDSSLLLPNRPFLDQFPRAERFDVMDAVELDADTLDAQLDTLSLNAIDVLKLDTQGTELHILQGASKTLSQGLLAVDVEVEFSPLYAGQPLFGDVDACLRRHELQLMDLAPRRWPYAGGEHLRLTRGPVVWSEAVYFPTLDRAVRDLSARPAEARTAALLKACLVALVYGFPDYAMALVARAATHAGEAAALAARAAVNTWDAEATIPTLPITIEATPEQIRALKQRQHETGKKPTAQLRKALAQWLKATSEPT